MRGVRGIKAAEAERDDQDRFRGALLREAWVMGRCALRFRRGVDVHTNAPVRHVAVLRCSLGNNGTEDDFFVESEKCRTVAVGLHLQTLSRLPMLCGADPRRR